MIFGNPRNFAIECNVDKFYISRGFFASGSFMYHISGTKFGVAEPEATFLASTYDSVVKRITERGQHFFASHADVSAVHLLQMANRAIYEETGHDELFLGFEKSIFISHVYERSIVMAPDGDAGFDDGSFIVQVDKVDSVCVAGTKSGPNALDIDIASITVGADYFYQTLADWKTAVETQRRVAIDQKTAW